MTEFIDITSTTIEYFYNGDKYFVTAEENDIVVFEIAGDESFECHPKTDLEYWVGALLLHYETDPRICWVAADYRRAAQVCLVQGHVMEALELEKICEISPSWGSKPATYLKCLRNLDLHNYAKKANKTFKEGAD